MDLLDALVSDRGQGGRGRGPRVNYRTMAACYESRRVSWRMRRTLEEFRDKHVDGGDEQDNEAGDTAERIAALEEAHGDIVETVEAQARQLAELERRGGVSARVCPASSIHWGASMRSAIGFRHRPRPPALFSKRPHPARLIAFPNPAGGVEYHPWNDASAGGRERWVRQSPQNARCDMSTPETFAKTTPKAPGRFRLPDIPEKHPDDMTSSKQLAQGGNQGRLESYLGHPESTIVSGERYVCAAPGAPMRYPDLLVALGADPELYEADNGYVASLQTARWRAVQKAKRKGLSIRGIARELGIHRDTAKKYMNADRPPTSPGRLTATKL